jgi:hypothetical protein
VLGCIRRLAGSQIQQHNAPAAAATQKSHPVPAAHISRKHDRNIVNMRTAAGQFDGQSRSITLGKPALEDHLTLGTHAACSLSEGCKPQPGCPQPGADQPAPAG